MQWYPPADVVGDAPLFGDQMNAVQWSRDRAHERASARALIANNPPYRTLHGPNVLTSQ
ncbi:hypothetical protein [Nocardia sp. NPDC004711]